LQVNDQPSDKQTTDDLLIVPDRENGSMAMTNDPDMKHWYQLGLANGALCKECGWPIAACNRIAILRQALERIAAKSQDQWCRDVAGEALNDA
jgi:hypothetical protein